MKAKNNFSAGVGRRKTAVSQTRITRGSGELVVNGKEKAVPAKITAMLELVGQPKELHISAIIRGGGVRSQLDALALGVARSLVDLNPDFRSTLRKAGFLTRDARVKERKKPGLRGARRAPQWAKR